MARKEKKAALPTMSLVLVGLACFFFFGAGAGFLWNKAQIHTLGEQIRGVEGRLDQAKGRRLMLERNYAYMCSYKQLERQVREMHLDLAPPQPDQLVRLDDAPPANDERLVARRSVTNEEGRD